MLFKFALKNVFRNKRRSFLSALAVFFGALVGSAAISYMSGMLNTMIDSYVDYEYSNVRVTTQAFYDNEKFFPVEEVMWDGDELKAQIESIEGVERVDERIRFSIIMGSGDESATAIGMGLDLLNNHLYIEDKLLEGEIEESGIYIGKNLAEDLGKKVGDEILIATKTSEGGLNGIKLPVKGIFTFGMHLYDSKFFLIGLDDAKKLLKINEGTTELYVYTDDNELTDSVQAEIRAILPDGYIALSFKDLMGELYQLLVVYKPMLTFFAGIIVFLASFVVINTMMMAIFERMHEIGTMKALGLTDRDLFINFTLEGAIIGAMGGILGATVGFILMKLLGYYGIDVTATASTMDMPFPYIIKPQTSIVQLFIAIFISIVVPALAAMLPARRAKKMTASEALRK